MAISKENKHKKFAGCFNKILSLFLDNNMKYCTLINKKIFLVIIVKKPVKTCTISLYKDKIENRGIGEKDE